MSDYLLTGIGKRIRSLRTERKQTLTELASTAGVSKGLLSKIENGRTVPSLPVLLSLIQALGLQPEDFFHNLYFTPPQRFIHRREADRVPIEKEEKAEGFHYFWLLDKVVDHVSMEVVILEILPGSERERVSVDAYELKYLLEGELDYQIGEETVRLQPGDVLFYDGRIPHVPVNRTGRPAKMLVVYLYQHTQ